MTVNNLDNSAINPERRAAVAKARNDWISKLIDLSRNNKLLYFRDLKTGTIDLSDSDPDTLRRFLCGEAVSLIRLLPHANEKATQARAQEIRRSALANLEEKGLETLFVAFGFASWPASDGGRPSDAPVLLVPVGFESRGRLSKASSLKIRGEAQVNPILLYVLEKEHGRKLDADALLYIAS